MKYKNGTFVLVPNLQRLATKSSELQVIYMWLCTYADKNGKCFPSRTTLAKQAGCGIKTVDKYLQQLVDDGFITKETRSKSGTKEKLSNMYQLLLLDEVEQEMPYPSVVLDTTPRVEKDTVTIPITNYTHITTLQPEVVLPKQEEVKPLIGQLPMSFGKTYIMRLHHVYRLLWKKQYGTALSGANIGRFGKAMKTLIPDHTEYQISALLLTFFNWYGASNDNTNDNKYLSDKGFPIEMMMSKIDIFITYLTNYKGLCYSNQDDVKRYVVERLKKLI